MAIRCIHLSPLNNIFLLSARFNDTGHKEVLFDEASNILFKQLFANGKEGKLPQASIRCFSCCDWIFVIAHVHAFFAQGFIGITFDRYNSLLDGTWHGGAVQRAGTW